MAIRLDIEALDSRLGEFCEELDQSLITFGRSKSCHIELDHPQVSRRHFIIKFVDNAYILLDEGSSHGTSLDGQQLEPLKSYPVGSKHQIKVPGFLIKLYCDGQKPRLERTTVVARKLLDELLQGEVSMRESPHLEAINGRYLFNFVEERTSFVLGTLSGLDFVVDDEQVSKKHVSFARDINGIRLIPVPEQAVFIDGKSAMEPQILTHGALVRVGSTELVYRDHSVKEQPEDDSIREEPEKIDGAPAGLPPVSTLDPNKITATTQKTLGRNPILKVLDRFFLLAFLLVLAGASVMFFELI